MLNYGHRHFPSCWIITIPCLYNLEHHRYNNLWRSPPVRELQVWHPTFLGAFAAVVVTPTTHRLGDGHHGGQAQLCSRLAIMPSSNFRKTSQCSSSILILFEFGSWVLFSLYRKRRTPCGLHACLSPWFNSYFSKALNATIGASTISQ
jgi:hypothetical protein